MTRLVRARTSSGGLERLCKVLQEPSSQALVELKEMQPLAKHLLETGRCQTEREAWGMAAGTHVSSIKRRLGKDSQSALPVASKIVDLNTAWGMTSAGVERLIGADKETVSTKHRKLMDESRVNDELEILSASEDMQDVAINDGSVIYLETYGKVRNGYGIRRDSGAIRRKQHGSRRLQCEIKAGFPPRARHGSSR